MSTSNGNGEHPKNLLYEAGKDFGVEEDKRRAYKVWVGGLSGVGRAIVKALSPEEAALHFAAALPFLPSRAGAFRVVDMETKTETRCVVSLHVVTVPNTTTGVNLQDPKGRPTTAHFADEPPGLPRRIVDVQIRDRRAD